jgi:hypothetical protein
MVLSILLHARKQFLLLTPGYEVSLNIIYNLTNSFQTYKLRVDLDRELSKKILLSIF